jgi:hypothetical protein
MTDKRIIPSFATEAEEAQWWFDHSDELDKDFEQAAAAGTLKRRTIARRFGLVTNFVGLKQNDADKARELAAKQGVEFEAFVQNLVHEALEQVAKAS